MKYRIAALLVVVVVLATAAYGQATDIKDVASPDGNVVAHFWWDSSSGKVSLSVTRAGITFLNQSPLGISFGGSFDLGSGFASPTTTVTNGNSDSVVLMSGKRRIETYQYGKLVAVCTNGNGHPFTVEVRASNDGVAFRYTIGGTGTANMTSEHTAYQLPAGPAGNTMGLLQSRVDADSNYEDDAEIRYQNTSVTGYPAESGYPALFNIGNGNWLMLTESAVDVGYPDGHLAKDSGVNDLYHQWFRGVGSWQVPLSFPFTTPWRVAILGNLETLFESDLVRELGQLPQPGIDFSFVTPGFAATSAYAANDNYNRSAVDSAVALHFPWVSFDDTWNQDPCITGSGTCTAPNGQSPIAYAHQKGLKVLLWLDSADIYPNSNPTTQLTYLHSFGADGAKVDFMQGYRGAGTAENPSQAYMNLSKYVNVADAAARLGMSIEFHGNSVPKGLERRYPNVLSLEGVRGSEHFYSGTETPTADQNNILTYTRNVVGSMDVMVDPHIECRTRQDQPTTTRGHTVAEAVVFESGLEPLWGGNADYVVSSLPNTANLFQSLPPAWDDVKWLGGGVGATTIVARRSGTSWFVGLITANGFDSTINIPLGFLDAGASYTATLYDDTTGSCTIGTCAGPSAECITNSSLGTVSNVTTLSNLPLKTGGGLVVRLTKN